MGEYISVQSDYGYINMNKKGKWHICKPKVKLKPCCNNPDISWSERGISGLPFPKFKRVYETIDLDNPENEIDWIDNAKYIACCANCKKCIVSLYKDEVLMRWNHN